MKNKMMFVVLMGMMFLSIASAYSDSVYVEDYDVEVEYTSAMADDVFSLVVRITNDASSERNLTLDFDDDDPFDFVSDDRWNVGVGAGETVSKTFRIEVDNDVDSKKYDLEFNLADESDDWDEEVEIKVVSDVAELRLGEIVSSPKKILPGSHDVLLEVVVKNSGDYDVEDLVAVLNLPEGFEASGSYSDNVHVGDLDEGESKTLPFYFDVEDFLGEDDYEAEIVFEYDCDGDSESSRLDLNLPVFSIPQFEIVDVSVLSLRDGSDDSRKGIYSGDKAKVKVALKNVGGEDARDVSLKVYERSDQPFVFNEKSVYVGSLDVGQIGYAVYDFDVEKGASAIDYLLDFQVRSVSGDSVIVDDVTAKIHVVKKEFRIEDYLVHMIVGLICLVGLTIFAVRRI